jgi:hypothetical protein
MGEIDLRIASLDDPVEKTAAPADVVPDGRPSFTVSIDQ